MYKVLVFNYNSFGVNMKFYVKIIQHINCWKICYHASVFIIASPVIIFISFKGLILLIAIVVFVTFHLYSASLAHLYYPSSSQK